MIANCTVEILEGAATSNSWGDTVLSETVFATTHGHIGTDAQLTGKDVTDRDGLTARRCRIRIHSSVALPANPIFRIDGVRWKPVAGKAARSLQLYRIYDCQLIE